MNLIVKKTATLNGQVSPPGSKSQSIRAIILASLCRGKSELRNVLSASDTEDAMRVCRDMGAVMTESDHALTITGAGLPFDIQTEALYSGHSGVTTHFIMPLTGFRKNSDHPIMLDGSSQMRARPINPLVDALRHLGLQIDYLKNPNTLPIRLSGKLTGGQTVVDGTTSQYLSALLFALPCAPSDSELIVHNLQERPYVEMTLQWLSRQGIQLDHCVKGAADIWKIKGGQSYQPFNIVIAGDFSSSSCLIAAAALIPGEVILQGIDMTDPQGDKQLVYILREMGADIEIQPTRLKIRGGKKLTGIKIDASDIPDLLPVLAVIATKASGKTEICAVAHARIKETDRIRSMFDGLSRMGANITEQDDGLIIYESVLQGAEVKGYGDHRTVMALALAGMIAEGITLIDESEAIHKTFPEFVETMQSIGAKMESDDAIIA